LYQCQPSNITWLSNNLSGSYKRAVGMGIQISVGNLAGGMLFLLAASGLFTDKVYSDGVQFLSQY
jgi:hypothetical protein